MSRSEGGCPREMPVSSRGARACSGWHLPGAAGRGRRPRVFRVLGIASQTGTGVGNQPRLQTERAGLLAGERAQEGGGRPRAGPGPGQRLEPKVKRVCVLLAHAQGFGWLLHRQDKKPVPVPSASYYPKTFHREMELAIRGCQEWGRRGASGVNRGEKDAFGSSTERGPSPDPSPAAGLCAEAGRPVGPLNQKRQ